VEDCVFEFRQTLGQIGCSLARALHIKQLPWHGNSMLHLFQECGLLRWEAWAQEPARRATTETLLWRTVQLYGAISLKNTGDNNPCVLGYFRHKGKNKTERWKYQEYSIQNLRTNK